MRLEQSWLWFGAGGGAGAPLAQRLDVIEDPETAAVRAGDQIVVVDRQIADGAGRHVEPQRLPRVAVVERNVDLRLAAGEEESAALRILSNHVDDRAVGNAVGDVRPALAAIARAIDVRPEIVEAEGVDRGVRLAAIEVRRLEDRDLRPRHQRGRRHVLPLFAAVGGYVNQSVVGARPDQIDVERGRRERVDHTALRDFCGR